MRRPAVPRAAAESNETTYVAICSAGAGFLLYIASVIFARGYQEPNWRNKPDITSYPCTFITSYTTVQSFHRDLLEIKGEQLAA